MRIGAYAGLVAGAVFAAHLCAIAEIASAPTTDPGIRSSTWTPLSGIASFLLGAKALHGSFWPGYVAVGLGIHLAMSVLVAVVGVWWIHICLGTTGPAWLAMALGIAYGLFVEVVAMQLVVNPIQRPNVVYGSLPPWAWWAGHGVYGAVLGLVAARRLRRLR
jgi:hypothetical protein